MVLSSGKVRKAEVMWCESWVRQLQLAQLPGPTQPPGEGKGAGSGQASLQELDLAFEGERISSVELCDQQGLGHFCSLSQIMSVHLLEELQFGMPQKEEFTVNPEWFVSRWQKGYIALVILVQIRMRLF